MNRLLQRQIKRSLGKDFDISTLDEGVQKLLQSIDSSYDDFTKERELLENTLEVSSNELTLANKIIKDQSLETSYLLKQYKETIDANFIVSKTDLNGKITYVNDIFTKVSGYSKEELLNQSHNILHHPENSSDFFKNMWDTILNKKVWVGAFANYAKDGSTYYIKATISPVLDLKSDIQEFISIAQDITEQILLEKKAQHLVDRTKQIMNAQDSMIVVSDSVNGVVEANQKFYSKRIKL